ncbi:16S rRNA (cytosine(967)-C(5))-methyltransferase RsmB [Veillonella criceti]|uniref:16S rRNA (cytosine(967)-C(5))-methyltransferase n=1 Tax=Veillonella criceti TaxID=103891 RepID=A0A380NGR1_9FIRM|nr:16S rRNA (cytosine(967)-C(5))-methyltransferase RsmB [Veillonella criceti]SUP40705.1 Ribosomal RNA small subunit methyltransferase B [Veillonella criceti]
MDKVQKSGRIQQGQVNIRRLAVQALLTINRDGAYANIVLQQVLAEHQLSDVDRRFFTELVYGVVRRRNYLDAIIEALAKRPLRKLSSIVVEILRLGFYQLIYMDKVPDSAAVNESVKLAKKMARGLDGFVNGVLRNFLRNREAFSIDELAKSDVERLAFIYNQPIWLLEHWLAIYGEEKTIGLCVWFNERPRLTARINTLKNSISDTMVAIEKEGWHAVPTGKVPEAIYITKHRGSLESSPLVKEGLLTFSDEASMAVAYVVDPKEGERVLDCCAAPGGKTMHMAARMNNKGHIVADDIHEHKLGLMEMNAKRLGVTNVAFQLQDATRLPSEWGGSFDKVLVDAPCSGLGILQRKLDMRWHKSAESLTTLPILQLQILEQAAKAVKPGGVLVYSTCTINEAENEDVVTTFLASHQEFSLEDAAPFLPFEVTGPMITLWPQRDEMDGFFIARLRKQG